jgi:hypothetical protein
MLMYAYKVWRMLTVSTDELHGSGSYYVEGTR